MPPAPGAGGCASSAAGPPGGAAPPGAATAPASPPGGAGPGAGGSISSSAPAGTGRRASPAPAVTGCFSCGLAAGLVVSATFNPWDRALFLSMIHKRAFFALDNWRDPYRGLAQTLAQRAVSTGLYFPLEEKFVHATGSPMLGGQFAGVCMGLLLNPLALVKYQSWDSERPQLFLTIARRLYHDRGPLVFLRGATIGAARDATFGACFAMRKATCVQGCEHDAVLNFVLASAWAAVGTTASSPFNYVRSKAYAEKSSVPLETVRSKITYVHIHLQTVWHEVTNEATFLRAMRTLRERFMLGWGTLRVAIGMAVADECYKACCWLRNDFLVAPR